MLNDELYIYKDSIKSICEFTLRSEYIKGNYTTTVTNQWWNTVKWFVEEKINECNNKDIEDIYKLMLDIENDMFN